MVSEAPKIYAYVIARVHSKNSWIKNRNSDTRPPNRQQLDVRDCFETDCDGASLTSGRTIAPSCWRRNRPNRQHRNYLNIYIYIYIYISAMSPYPTTLIYSSRRLMAAIDLAFHDQAVDTWESAGPGGGQFCIAPR